VLQGRWPVLFPAMYVLQRVAVICSVRCRDLHTATHCNTLQHTATHCNTLQHTATHCFTLQHTATHCSTLQHTATHCNTHCVRCRDLHTATHCNTLQYTATHCFTLQHTATHCNTLQHTATHTVCVAETYTQICAFWKRHARCVLQCVVVYCSVM